MLGRTVSMMCTVCMIACDRACAVVADPQGLVPRLISDDIAALREKHSGKVRVVGCGGGEGS
jgi:hypothetical protein